MLNECLIRPCHNLKELAACVELQKKIWGYGADQVYPLRLFVNLQRTGGLVLGAFAAGDRLIGFLAAMPAWRGKRRYYHSLALGVAPGHENRGVGKALKWEQRRRALQSGIDCIEWTFDPLRARNAYLNIQRLGAIARRYLPDYYGGVQSRLQQGLASDRLMCEWWLKSSRVRRAKAGQNPRPESRKAAASVPIPPEIWGRAARYLPEARTLQLKFRREILDHLDNGYAITGVSLDGLHCFYLLDRASRFDREWAIVRQPV